MNDQEIHGRPSSSFEGGVIGSHRDPLRILWISAVSYPISDLHANGIFDAFVDFREIAVIQGVVVFQVSPKWPEGHRYHSASSIPADVSNLFFMGQEGISLIVLAHWPLLAMGGADYLCVLAWS